MAPQVLEQAFAKVVPSPDAGVLDILCGKTMLAAFYRALTEGGNRTGSLVC